MHGGPGLPPDGSASRPTRRAMAESARKIREDAGSELRIPERPRPEQLIDRHKEWITASTAAPYHKRHRRRTRRFRAASLIFPGAVGLAALAALLAVALLGRGERDPAPLRDQLIPGGSGSDAVVVKSVAPAAKPGELRDRDAGDEAARPAD